VYLVRPGSAPTTVSEELARIADSRGDEPTRGTFWEAHSSKQPLVLRPALSQTTYTIPLPAKSNQLWIAGNKPRERRIDNSIWSHWNSRAARGSWGEPCDRCSERAEVPATSHAVRFGMDGVREEMSTHEGHDAPACTENDALLRTENNESKRWQPEQGQRPFRSLYAPKRVRSMRGGPPVYLGRDRPAVIELPRFLLAPDPPDDGGQSQPAPSPSNRSTYRTSRARELLTSRFHADLPARNQQPAENARDHISRDRSLVPHELLPPALVRAQQRKTARGPLPFLLAGVLAATAYLVSGSSGPPPRAPGESNLHTVGLEEPAPPLPPVQTEVQLTEAQTDGPDLQASLNSETSSSAAQHKPSTGGLKGRQRHTGAQKRAAASPTRPRVRSATGPVRESTRAIQGGSRCVTRCTGFTCSSSSHCAGEKGESTRAQAPAGQRLLPGASPARP
jgi:hypothetical protein